MPDDDLITLEQTAAPSDRSWACSLALVVLGRGRSDADIDHIGETRTDYARRCNEAERTLIEADDADVIDAVKRMSAGSTVSLVGRAIRRLASRRVVTEEILLTPSGNGQAN